ncbi:hypothetical protein KQX54_018942 [Cotesia glomerata]|uniref:Uncharacterized protein n=1 Tax=Cotesia glomerata TaxID=32391 RepID=A0AAV7J9C3_COTGL|nr:hypothetical protein KQX54_018942 [Cotesia glomerata]
MSKHKKKSSSRERERGEKRKSSSRDKDYEILKKRCRQLEKELSEKSTRPSNGDQNVTKNEENKEGEEEVVIVNVAPLDLSKNNSTEGPTAPKPAESRPVLAEISPNVKEAAAKAAELSNNTVMTSDSKNQNSVASSEQETLEEEAVHFYLSDGTSLRRASPWLQKHLISGVTQTKSF